MKYDLIVKCGNSLGFGWLETIVELANQGAVLKEGVMQMMKFPHTCYMQIESDVDPIATPTLRVFREDKTEVFIVKEEDEVSEFTMTVDTSVRLTKEQLDALEWTTEFKAVMKADGIGGRDRNKMTTQYLKNSESV